jgi:predicted dinucleotide-binding enzyme
MSNRRTFAVLGVSETNSIFLAKQIAKTNPVLLFDHDAVVLNTVYSQILSEYSNANAEMMICPTNASWEADVIILSNAAATDANLIEKIRNVATGKIVLFLGNKKNTNTSGNSAEKLQHLFPFSKVVQSFESAVDSNNSLFLNGNDKEAVKTILTLFTSIGLEANII